jgi:flagellin
LEGITGKGSNLSLEINLAASRPVDGSVDGGSYYQYVDRVITHEITHAVMSSTMNFGDLPIWFIEGTAEFSHGADERLKNAIAILGKGIDKASLDDGVKQVVDAIGDGGEAAWNGGNPPSYSAAYLSTRYLDHQIREAGGNGIRDITEYLAANPTKTLVDALDNASHGAFSSGGGKTSYEDFIAKFKADVTDWDSMVDKTGVKLDMGISDGRLENEKDTGSVLGSDVTGNPLNAKTAESIVPEPGGVGAAEVEQPMNGFKLFWPATTGGGISTPYRAAGKTASDPDEPLFQLKRNEFYLQIGANKSQGMAVYLNDMQADSLEIVGDKGGKIKLDSGTEVYLSTSDEARVTNGEDDEVVGYAVDIMSAKTASAAIEVFSQALNKVSLERSRLGAYQNRLEHTINNLNVAEENLQASESRISDADIAKMSLIFTKQNIKMQAAQSMLAQSNQQPQAVLQLLR